MPAIAIGVGSVVGGIVSAVGAHKAASVQASAADKASQMTAATAASSTAAQKSTADQQMALEKQIYDQQQAAQAPYQQTGNVALNQLNQGVLGTGDLVQPWTKSFDPNSVAMDPGFQQRLDAGNKAIMNQASARGDNLGSGTTQSLVKFNQDYTSQGYGDAYNRAQQQYQEAYQTFNDNQSRKLNPLMSLAGFGQNANAAVANAGNNFVSSSGNTAQGSTTAINNINANATTSRADYATQAANANASGYVGIGNAINKSIGPVTQAIALSKMNKPS